MKLIDRVQAHAACTCDDDLREVLEAVAEVLGSKRCSTCNERPLEVKNAGQCRPCYQQARRAAEKEVVE